MFRVTASIRSITPLYFIEYGSRISSRDYVKHVIEPFIKRQIRR
jgi:hypothetical protein